MVQQVFSNEKLFELAKINYDKLSKLCNLLVENGYWEKPQQVLKMSAGIMLDTYLQAVLMQIAKDVKDNVEIEQKFIVSLTKTNPYQISAEQPVSLENSESMQKVFQSPPILLQLFGVFDQERKKSVSFLAFDCFLNIILSVVYLNHGKNRNSLKAVEEYYKRTIIFLNARMVQQIFNQRYLFVKMSNDRLDTVFYEEFCGEASLKDIKKRQIERIENLKGELKKERIEKPREEQKESGGNKEGLEQYIVELNSLIGLNEVKKEVNSLINLIKVKKMKEKHGMPFSPMTYHMVFTGNPGTGKTTVARLISRIYKELGILTEGHLIETDRSGLVAGYVGQTALKVKEVVEKATGGVLFIDEAYSLANQAGSTDFGAEAIDALVKLMEDNRANLVVIVAGYQKEMELFLHSNPGLISRFNRFIEFKDYTIEELMEILKCFIQKDGMVLTEDAKAEIERQLVIMTDEEKTVFGNGRGIRNMFEKILISQANRIVNLENPSRNDLEKVTLDDIIHLNN